MRYPRILGLLALLSFFPASPRTRGADAVRVLVSFRGDGTPGAGVRSWIEAARRSQGDVLHDLARHHRISGSIRSLWIAHAMALTATPEMIADLARDPRVESVETDETLSLDEARVRSLVGPRAAVPYGIERLRAPEVWSTFGITGAGVRVGLIDSGVDAGHPDLAGKVAFFRDLTGGGAEPYDDHGHGTHCAGTIAGGSSIGVAPGATILAVKAFDARGATTKERLLEAMQVIADPDGNPATADHPAICSNSWHGSGGRKFFLRATQRWLELGILPVFATGNDGPTVSTTWIPAGYLESIAVGATDRRDAIPDFSSRGPIFWDGIAHVKPDVCAPGEDVLSAAPGGGHIMMSGTSMAAPHAAGVLALLREARPDLPIAALRAALEETALDLREPGRDNLSGAGRIDALAAVTSVTSPRHALRRRNARLLHPAR